MMVPKGNLRNDPQKNKCRHSVFLGLFFLPKGHESLEFHALLWRDLQKITKTSKCIVNRFKLEIQGPVIPRENFQESIMKC